MPTTVAQLAVKVGGETSEAENKLTSLSGHVNTVGGHFKSALGSILGFAGGALAIGGVTMAAGLLVGQMKSVITEGMSQQAVMTDTVAVLKSMGSASGMTAKSIGDYADKMAQLTGVSDDVIQHSENVLLTFGNLGKNIFPQAETAAMNMAARLGGGSPDALNGAVLQVGKALNDPIKGINALGRAGVSFTEGEKETIKTMMAHNNIAGAQGIIMSELTKQFGGAAVAAGTTFGGQMARLNVTMDQAKEKIGLALIPILQQLMAAFTPLIGIIGGAVTGAFSKVTDAMRFAGPIIMTIMSDLKVLVAPLQDIFASLGDVVSMLNPFKQGAAGAANAITGFVGKGGELQKILKVVADVIEKAAYWIDTFVAGITNGVGPLGGLKAAIAPIITAFTNWQKIVSEFELGALSVLWTALTTQVLPVLGRLAGVIISTVVPIVRTLFQVFQSDILPTLRTLWSVIQANVLPALSSIWATISSKLLPALENLWVKISPVLIPALQLVGGILKNTLGPAFQAIGWTIQNVVAPALNLIINIISSLINFLATAITSIGNFLGLLGHIKDAVGGALGGVGNALHGAHIPGFAVGGVMAQSGLAMVGEHGPEVVALPAGARVYPSGTGPKANGTTYNITMNGTNLSVQDLQRELWRQAVLHG